MSTKVKESPQQLRLMAGVVSKVVEAYRKQRDPIPDSDLDNEQPVTLLVSTTLGNCGGWMQWSAPA
jgi:hypothetical protein